MMNRKSVRKRRAEYLAEIRRDPEKKRRFDALVKDLDAYIEKNYVPVNSGNSERG